MKLPSLFIVCLFFALPANAQDSTVEEIVVTAQRIGGPSYGEPRYNAASAVPVVRTERRADNLIVSIQVINDTRDAAIRRTEITRSLTSMARAAAGRGDIDLSIIKDGSLVPFTESMISTLTLGVDDDRDDTSVATLIVKTPIREGDTLDSASTRVEDFVEGAAMTGRSLAEISGSWQLSIVDPPQYRDPVVRLIAEDARATAAAFGEGYAVTVTGLEGRVAWQQSGPLSLILYIPYQMMVTPRP
jgi:hypothetical protein